jgi:hypothetical protein
MSRLLILTRDALDLFRRMISAAFYPGRINLSPVMVPIL